jgi:hypothetical protein
MVNEIVWEVERALEMTEERLTEEETRRFQMVTKMSHP